MIRPAARALLLGVSSLIAALVLAATVAIGFLLHGPIVLDFLNPALESALDRIEPGIKAHIGSSQLQFDRDRRRVQLSVTGLELQDAENASTLVKIDHARIDLASHALLRGVVAPTRIVVLQPDFVIARDEQNALGLGDAAPLAQSSAILKKWLAPGQDAQPANYLREIAIEDGNLRIEDAAMHGRFFETAIDVSITRNNGGIAIGARIRRKGGGRANLTANLDRNSATIGGQIGLDHIVPAQWAGLSSALAALKSAELPISGVASVTSDLDFNLLSASAKLTSEGGRIVLQDLFDSPPALGALSLEAAMEGPKTIEIRQLTADLGGPQLSGALRLTLPSRNESPGIAGDLYLDSSNVADLMRLWPVSKAAGGRRWISNNLPSGRLSSIHAAINMAPGAFDAAAIPADAINVEFDFDDLAVHYLGELPKLEAVRGNAHLTADGIDLGIAAGRSAGLTLAQGHVRLTDFQGPVAHGEIAVVFAGSVPDSAALLDLKPLGYARRVGLNPRDLGGQQTTELHVALPLIEALTMDQVKIRARVKLSGLIVPEILGHRKLTDGELAAEVTNDGLLAKGTAKLSGVNLEIGWNENFNPSSAATSQFQIAGTLSDSDRDQLGIPTGSRLTGAVSARAEISGHGFATDQLSIHVTLDLQKAVLNVPELGLHGIAAGSASFAVDLRVPDRIAFTDVKLAGPDLTVQGRAALDSQGRLLALHAEPLRVANATDCTLDVASKERGYKIDLSGRSFDATALRESEKYSGEDTPGPPIEISVRLAQAILAKDARPVEGLVVTADYDGRKTTALSLVGHSAKEGLFRAAIASAAKDRRTLTITAQNAASVLAALGFFGEGDGGTLAFSATADDSKALSTWTGRLQISQMRVAKVPLLAQLLTLASLTGLSDTLQGKGILFEDITGEISAQAGRTYIKDGLAVGPDLCFTVSGVVDGNQDQLDLAGAVVPICSVNALLGSVPVIGTLIVGRKNEGIIGVDYTIKGPFDQPTIVPNPLSPLAPGFLKRIFDILGGPPDAPPKQAAPPH